MRQLKIDNKTHWQTRDVSKMLTAVLKHSTFKPNWPIQVTIHYSKAGNSYGEYRWDKKAGELLIGLPKRGPKMPSLQALAVAAVTEQRVLAPSVVYCLARTLCYQFMSTTIPRKKLTNRLYKRKLELEKSRSDATRPSWLPADLFIKRYAPKKAPPKKTFMEKVEEALGRAEARVEEWEGEVEHAEANLKRAQRDLKKEQKRLRDARKRAEERGEKVEFIGPGHRLHGRI